MSWWLKLKGVINLLDKLKELEKSQTELDDALADLSEALNAFKIEDAKEKRALSDRISKLEGAFPAFTQGVTAGAHLADKALEPRKRLPTLDEEQ